MAGLNYAKWFAPATAFLISVAFWPGISGAATSPRWAIAAVSLGYLDWRLLPFVAFCFFAVDFDSAVHWAIVCAAFCWGLNEGQGTGSNIRKVCAATCGGIAISGVIAAFQCYGFEGIPQLAIPGGLFLNKNFMGEAACLALIASLQYRLWLPALICVPALILSTSRASWIGAILSICFILPWRWAAGLLFLAAIMLCAGYLAGVETSPATLLQRLSLWHDAIQNFHWLGSGAYDYSTIQYREPNLHNDWLQLIYEFGIVGLIPLIVVFMAGGNGLPFAVALLVIGSFGFPLQMPATAWFAAFMLGHFVGRGHDAGRSVIRPWRPNWRLHSPFSRA
jgi:hypothetical protein